MSRRRAAGEAAWLTAGSILSGLAAYLFIAIGTRSIGAEEFAPVSIVWTLWAASAAVLTFPVQHWLIRTVEASGGERALARSIRQLAVTVPAVSVVTFGACWLWRVDLFGSELLVYPLVTAAVPFGSILTGWTRGVLAARGRYTSVAGVILGENVLRVVPAWALVAAGRPAPGLFAAAILCGFAIVLGWPSTFQLAADGGADPSRSTPLGFMAGIAGGSLASQLVLTAAPLILTVTGGAAAAVTSLFAAMALLRSPYMVATGMATRLTQPLTRAATTPEGRTWSRVRSGLLGATMAAALVAFPFGFWVFGPLLRLVFGATVQLPPLELAGLAVGGAVSIGSLAYTLLFVALDRSKAATQGWLVGIAAAIVALVVVAEPLAAVVVAFLVAEVVAFAAMAILELRVVSTLE